MSEKHTISIYGCGGAGINIVSKVLKIPSSMTGFPNVEYTLVDTSDSNLNGVETKGEFATYLIPGLDGAGGDRRFGFENVESHVDPILTKHKPKDHCIVVFSLSGGSGSVIGPLLVRELLMREKNVICVCIGNTSNAQEAENTLKTIATLQGISKHADAPIAVCFYDNDIHTNRVTVDEKIENDVRAIALLLSGCNEELDSMDIHKVLYFSPLAKVPPQVVDLLVYSQADSANDPKGFIPICVVSVLPSRTDQTLRMGQPFGRVGYMPAATVQGSAEGIKPLHFILTNAFMNERLENYQKVVTDYKEGINKLQNQPILQVIDGEVNEGGFLF